MFLLSGFVMPCLQLSLKAIHTRLIAADSSNSTTTTCPIASTTDTGTNTATATATATATGNSTGTDAEAAAATTFTPASVANNHLTSPSATHTAARVVARLMTRLLRPIVAVADDESGVLSPQGGIELDTLFLKTKFQVQLISAATLLLTFGLVFPPLAVVICVAVWSETCFTQTLMRRLLAEAEGVSAETGRLYRQQLERDAEGLFLRK
jgi:hypothetical protein